MITSEDKKARDCSPSRNIDGKSVSYGLSALALSAQCSCAFRSCSTGSPQPSNLSLEQPRTTPQRTGSPVPDASVGPSTQSDPPPVNPEPAPELVKPPTPQPTPEPPPASNADAGKDHASASPPPLYKPEKAIDTAALREEFERPWKGTAAPSPLPVVHVIRKAPLGGQPRFESLTAALAATVNDRETIIEINDDGPYFTPALAFERRNITLRAAKGCRPLIVWDLRGRASDKAGRLFTASRGNLRLENVDVGVRTADAKQPESFALFQVTDGDFWAEGCTFSIAGQHAKGVAVVRLQGDSAMGNLRCRLDRCYVRGSEAVLLETRAGAEVLVSDCLVAGGRRPLIDITASPGTSPTTVRTLRSTFVGERAFLQIRYSLQTGAAITFRWLGWDTLVGCGGTAPSGDMVVLLDQAVPGNIQWKPVNCLYAGWSSLLATPARKVSDLDSWRTIWHVSEGEAAFPEPWPSVANPEPAEAKASEYQTAGTSASYAAMSQTGALGCDVSKLPPAPDRWVAKTYQ